jgi:enamine deaminase RidA (YjgF/YER057c/UK114 family)
VRAGGAVHVSGMTAVGPEGGLVGGDDPYAQAVEALRKVAEALAAAGAGMEHVVRTRMYVTRPEFAAAVGRAHQEALGHVMPAATMVVCELLDPRMLVEIEADARLDPDA